jgi:putative redox protein
VTAIARRRDGFCHELELDGGHRLLVDEPVGSGGSDAGPSPTRLLAGSLASCIAITVEMYAERKGWDLGSVEVEVETDYEGPRPAAFRATLRLPPGLDDAQLERLRAIAGRCPVDRALTGQTPVAVELGSAPA